MRTLFFCTALFLLLVLGLTSCDATSVMSRPVVSMSVESASAESTPEATETAMQPTPTIFVYPDVSSRDFPCAIDLYTRLILHERGRVADDDDRPLNMREGPDVEFTLIRQLSINSVFLVLEGPECTDDYIWYYIRYEDSEGWIAEGESGIYYVEPYFPG